MSKKKVKQNEMLERNVQIHFKSSVNRPSDQDVNWMSPVQGKSSLVQVKEPYGNLDMVTCRLSSCNPECSKYTCR